MPLIDKVRLPKPRLPEPSPKEKAAWTAFIELANGFGGAEGVTIPPVVLAELERLCERGNPLALRFKERVDISNFQPRKVGESPAPTPPKRRIAMVRWGKPETKG